MDTRTRRDIALVNETMGYLANLPGQDSMLVIECGQHMLFDLLGNDTLDPIGSYVKEYCDVIDGPEDADRIEMQILLNYANYRES